MRTITNTPPAIIGSVLAIIGAVALWALGSDSTITISITQPQGNAGAQIATGPEMQPAGDRGPVVVGQHENRPGIWYRCEVAHSSRDGIRRVANADDPDLWERRFQGFRDRGQDYVFLWHPNGATATDGWMQFDWIADGLLDPRADNLTGWRPHAAKWLDENKDRRCVVYIGAPGRGGTNEGEAYEEFVLEWILATHDRIEIAFDAGAPTGIDSPTYRWAEKLRARGVTVWVEALVPLDGEHWKPYGQVCTDRYIRNRMDVAVNPNNGNYTGVYDRMAPDQMRESVVFMTGHSRVPMMNIEGEAIDSSRLSIDKPGRVYGAILARHLYRQGHSIGVEYWKDEDRGIVTATGVPDRKIGSSDQSGV